MTTAPTEFAQATILSPSGEKSRVADLWTDRTVVFALVRQFG